MAYHASFLVIFMLYGAVEVVSAGKCDRKLDGTYTPPGELEGMFYITIWTLNKTDRIDQYMPNTRYIVTIDGDKENEIGPEKFTRFLLTADNKNESSTAEGTFDLVDEMLTQFSAKCPNSVQETSQIPKESVNVAWTSPPEGNGCILIRATVMETPETWFIDEGPLVRTICQDPKAVEDDPGPVLPECCACDEAKYEVTFEGLWSRNTHPKDFPSKGWLIRFSDVIGASHTFDYRFWSFGETASEGLQQVAEYGSTRKLESELKNKSENIRTIIKARGISHPNVTGRTFAVFRVDQKHHLMSLVSMIVPSPDWIVGVSGLELCLSNCSWIEHKELNLYPVDVGTDDGITYMSPDSPSDPPEPIRQITTKWPNDSRSPFYDPFGFDMKPMAKLHLNRQRLYEKACEDSPVVPVNSGGDSDDNQIDKPPKRHRNKACRTTQWGSWGPCSASCGRGKRLRQRHYKDKATAAANNCNATLTDREDCYSNSPDCNGRNGEDTILNTPACELSEWSSWSSCTTTCGGGSQTRSRNFIHKKHRKYCKAVADGPDLEITIDCGNEPCENATMTQVSMSTEDIDEEVTEATTFQWENEDMSNDAEVIEEWLQKCPPEKYSEWSTWTPCSSTCENGTKTRSRLPLDSSDYLWECRTQEVNCTAKIMSCKITSEDAEEICNEPLVPGSCNLSFQRVHFNSSSDQCEYFNYRGCDGNRNNFQTIKQCRKVCIELRKEEKTKMQELPKNFKVSLSSVLSYHIPVRRQRRRKSKRTRLDGEEKEDFNGIQTGSQVMSTTQEYNGVEKIDCEVSKWSKWTRCRNCQGYTTRFRKVLSPENLDGKECRQRLRRKKKCIKMPECSLSFAQRSYRDRKSIRDHARDCQLTHWSSWSPCHASCGNAVQHRTRKIRVYPNGRGAKPCTKLVEFRKCSELPCS